MSRTSARGDMCGDIPPRRSMDANCRLVRSSYRVSPPNMAAINGASGLRMLLT